MPISPGPFCAVNSLMNRDSPVSRRFKPPRILVFMRRLVSIVAMAEASTLMVCSGCNFTVRKLKSGWASTRYSYSEVCWFMTFLLAGAEFRADDAAEARRIVGLTPDDALALEFADEPLAAEDRGHPALAGLAQLEVQRLLKCDDVARVHDVFAADLHRIDCAVGTQDQSSRPADAQPEQAFAGEKILKTLPADFHAHACRARDERAGLHDERLVFERELHHVARQSLREPDFATGHARGVVVE